MTLIEWDRLGGQQGFDRVVELFIKQRYAHLGSAAYAVNGRGGDEGIDIRVQDGRRLIIFQLKFFPDGFSGGWAATRKQQIERSFSTALKHRPSEWHLVVPATLRMPERLWVLGLKPRNKRTPKIFILDQTGLDQLASEHPQVTAHVQRDPLIETLRQFNQESAALAGPDDLTERVAALGKQAETVDPFWTWDFEWRDKMTIRTLRPLRDDAAEQSPIEIRLDTSFGSDHAELREAFRRVIGYGVAERVDLPREVISALEFSGPASIVQSEHELEALSIVPREYEGPNYEIELRIQETDGAMLASHSGTVTRFDRGLIGGSLQAAFYGSARLTFLFPLDPEKAEGKLDLTLDFQGVLPAQAISSIELLEDLRQAAQLELRIDGRVLCTIGAPDDPHVGAQYEELGRLREIAEDLEIVQRHTRQTFSVPGEISAEDRLYLRCMRLLIDGHCVVMPGQRELTFTLSGEDGPHLRSLLSGDFHRLAGVYERFGYEMFGRKLMLGETTILLPKARTVDGEPALAALESGTAAGHKLTMECVDDLSVWYFMPSRLNVGTDDAIRPIPWGLPEYPDPPDITYFATDGPGEVSAADAMIDVGPPQGDAAPGE